MKKAFFTLLATSALACANDVVYDFFSQDVLDMATDTAWGQDAQGHSGTITTAYKTKPAAGNGTISNRVLDWEMQEYNSGYKKFTFDALNLKQEQTMTLMFDVILQEPGYDAYNNYEGVKTSMVSLGISNVGIGSNGGAGLSVMTTGTPVEGYNNSINAPSTALGESDAGKTVSFVTTYHYANGQWKADLVMTCGGETWTASSNMGSTLSVDHLYVSMDGTNWAYNGQSGNTTSKMANLKLIVSEVPEPATATLSLLALAGLCARRRR